MKTNPTHGWVVANSRKLPCQFCTNQYGIANIKRHESHCYLNPAVKRDCEVCGNAIKNKTSATCSYGCANTKFKSGKNNPNWKDDSYRSTCFHHHTKECVVCKEKLIVAVHHLDENHENNDPANLIPLCPTHHSYWHSQHKHVIEQVVLDYVAAWKLNNV